MKLSSTSYTVKCWTVHINPASRLALVLKWLFWSSAVLELRYSNRSFHDDYTSESLSTTLTHWLFSMCSACSVHINCCFPACVWTLNQVISVSHTEVLHEHSGFNQIWWRCMKHEKKWTPLRCFLFFISYEANFPKSYFLSLSYTQFKLVCI